MTVYAQFEPAMLGDGGQRRLGHLAESWTVGVWLDRGDPDDAGVCLDPRLDMC